jgi:hypothetical protein
VVKMSYDAKVFNVMIASPGDIVIERKIVRDVIHDWNIIHSQKRSLVLLPVGWETHSSPEMGSTPQDILNKQILEKCDLLVGVFWTRIGTATTEYNSGTVEEIEEHIKANKPAMLYFSSQPAALDTVDSEQYEQLKAFKTSCSNRGLYEVYDSISVFKDKFQRQLQQKVNDHPLFEHDGENETETSLISQNTKTPKLSEDASSLLKEATMDKNGIVLHLRSFDGTDIEANDKKFINNKDQREIARWTSAIEELIVNRLIVDRGNKGEIYEVTNQGYKIADLIEM